MGWKVGVIEHLHAKLCIIETPRTWIVYLGSSNLSQAGNVGTNLEFNVRLVFPTLPPAVKSFIKRCVAQANKTLSKELLEKHVVKWKGLDGVPE
jgi:phosphatidylserine/phosphatidylglycerophosphate/cardiolipin synthase-like enzyme